MKVDGGLGLAGCPGTESNQRNILLRSYHVIEFGRVVREERWKLRGVRIFVKDDFFKPWRSLFRFDELLRKLFFAQRVFDPGLGDDRRQLLRAEKRHSGYRDAAGFEHG